MLGGVGLLIGVGALVVAGKLSVGAVLGIAGFTALFRAELQPPQGSTFRSVVEAILEALRLQPNHPVGMKPDASQVLHSMIEAQRAP